MSELRRLSVGSCADMLALSRVRWKARLLVGRVEELLIAIFQFLFETLLDGWLYWPFESATARLLKSRPAHAPRASFPVIVAIIAGALVGVISLVVWPHTWLRWPALRVANLVAAPLISACSAWWIASHRPRQPSSMSAREHAGFGFAFTMTFMLVRFTWGTR